MEKTKDQILRDAMRHMGKPIDEITRRMTYRSRSPGVKPTTGIKVILPKTSSMAEKIQKVLDGDDPKKLKQMNNLVIGREDDGKEISLEFKTSASRERFRKMMNEGVELDEMKKSDGPFTVVALKNNKVVGQVRGIEHNEIEDAIQSMKADNKGAKISVESKNGKVVHTEEVEQVDEMSPFNVMGGKKTATPRKMGRDLENRLKMTKPSEYTFSAPAAGGGTFAVIPVNMERPSMLSQAGVMMATFDKRGKVLAYYGTHMDTDAAKKFAKKEGLIESVRLDEGSTIEFKFDNPIKAGDFMRRIMRDKLASEVDRYGGDRSTEEIVQVIMHPNDYERNDIEKLAKRYKGELREDVQLDENVQNQVKRMDRRAKQRLAKKLNDLDLSGYGDYEARVDNVHKFKSSDLKMAMEMMSLKEAESLRWTSMKDTEREELVRLAGVPSKAVKMEWRQIPAPLKEKLAKYINKSTKGEFALVEEKAMTYVVDRKTKKIVHGPTDTGDAKLYLNKQVQPRKFMIRQIRGAAKKVGDTV